MAKKTWIVWALFLLLPGFVGLSIHHAQKNAMENRIALATEQAAENPAAQDYLKMYEQWSDLPADQKADNPWGYGSYGGSEIRQKLTEGQSDRLIADMQDLEKGLAHYPDELADVLYGPQWQQEVEDYKKQRTVMEMVLIGSIFLLAGGSLFLVGGLAKVITVHIIKKRFKNTEESRQQSEDIQDLPVSEEPVSEEPDSDDPETPSLLANSSASTQKEGNVSEKEDNISDKESAKEDEGYFKSSQRSKQNDSSKSENLKVTELPMKPAKSRSDRKQKLEKDSYFGWAIESEGSEQFESLMTNEPLTKELTELTEEVSAIRNFAAQQQDQMRKLQDGYDWMIIRRFCLRIIRCIDNIDDRVTHIQAEGGDAAVYLEDIRDELVFALEASGIEQFGPDLQTSFKGLEKYAEAVRERVYTEDSELVGCIAEVARPGYQYLVNDDEVKIVRCAQVKLYESKQT